MRKKSLPPYREPCKFSREKIHWHVVQLLMMEECKFSSLTLVQVFSILLVFQLIYAIHLKGRKRCVKIIHSTLSKKLDTTAWTRSREVRSVLERCPANISQNWSMKMTWKQQGQSIHVHFREPSVFQRAAEKYKWPTSRTRAIYGSNH